MRKRGPRQCDMQIRYGRANAIREYAMGSANAIRDTRMRYIRAAGMRYAIREYATRYEQLQSGFLGHNTRHTHTHITHTHTHTHITHTYTHTYTHITHTHITLGLTT